MKTKLHRRRFFQAGAVALAGTGIPTLSANSLHANEGHSVWEEGRDILVVEKSDVIVCGAGPAGIAAALAAARTGASVRLLEMQGCLGGIWTAGLLSWVLDTGDKYGIMAEIIQRITAMNAGYVHPYRKSVLAYDAEVMKVLLEEMCLAEGIKIRYHTMIVGAVKNAESRITHVITESKSGREVWAADVCIDTTGDGDLCAQVGCGFDLGRDEDGKMQPMSMFAIVTGLDPEETQDFYLAKDTDPSSHKKKFLHEIKSAGVTPSYTMPTLFRIHDDLYVLMVNHEYGFSGLNADDVTQATLHARQEIHTVVRALKASKGPWEGMRIVATSEQIGIREGRRIHGLYTVTVDDLRNGSRFEDGICRVHFGVDVHALSNEDQHGGGGIMRTDVARQPYDIPLRSLIAKDIHGLLMAGRNISGDFIAHSSYRVTGNSVQCGQAAGVLAAISVRNKRAPHTLSWSEVGPAVTSFGQV